MHCEVQYGSHLPLRALAPAITMQDDDTPLSSLSFASLGICKFVCPGAILRLVGPPPLVCLGLFREDTSETVVKVPVGDTAGTYSSRFVSEEHRSCP
jgi:hypothetical protein